MNDILNERAVTLLDELHAELDKKLEDYPEPALDDLFNRLGVIIAMLKGEYDPDED